jgi:hypothetical protein
VLGGARVPPQLQGLEKLIQAGYPAGLQRFRDSLVGFQENGYVGFDGMEDKDGFNRHFGLSLSLSLGQPPTPG